LFGTVKKIADSANLQRKIAAAQKKARAGQENQMCCSCKLGIAEISKTASSRLNKATKCTTPVFSIWSNNLDGNGL